MNRAIHTENLRVGMYIHLPGAWHNHPFVKNEFSITSESQIQKILESGIKEVVVDPGRSVFPKPQNRTQQAKSIVPDELREAIYDPKLPAQEKAKTVKEHSSKMIKNLLDAPSTENIREARQGIAELVDLILKDDATSVCLLSITSHDYYTYTHSVNVGFLAISLSKLLFKNSTGHDLHELGVGFFLHDLGKIHVDPAIINKPGRLTEEEMRQMRQHPNKGYMLLYETKQLTAESAKIVLQHHERYDGSGYPKGLKGSEIHLYGRICSVADVFDALTSDRPYRQKLHPFDALKLMKKEMINHFQMELFEKFIYLLT